MPTFTSKELYMMNGGQLLHMYKDGFGDIYKATPAEEAKWAAEVVDNALQKIATEQNRSQLQSAIDTLIYHKYSGLDTLLLNSINESSPERQIVFASALWKMVQYKKSFEIIFKILLQHRAKFLNDVFLGLNDFKEHEAAKHFLVNCLEGDDDELAIKAQLTLSMWAWRGLPALRENKLLEALQPEYRNLTTYKPAIERVKQILNIIK